MHHLIHDIKTLGLEMIEGRQVARRLKSLLPVRLKKICAELKKAEEDSHLKKALNERVAKGLDSRHDDASKRSLFKINEHCE